MQRDRILMTLIAATAVALWAFTLVPRIAPVPSPRAETAPRLTDTSTPAARAFARSAMSQVGRTVGYDAAYVELDYPGGDVPIETGVCTDVIVRALRDCGIDLQVEVHQDMEAAFSDYPSTWGLESPDPNIDHRRVPNLRVFFERKGMVVPVTDRGEDYLPGDIVTWRVIGKPHIGIVSTQAAEDGTRFCIVHNIGCGAHIEDCLFQYEITGHYRWFR